MIIAFCDMKQEGEEASVNMIASALGAQVMGNAKVLMLQSGFGAHHIEDAIARKNGIMLKEPFAYMEGEGMDYLMKKSSNHMLSEKTTESGIVYVMENLGYIPGAVKKNRMIYELEFEQECRNILKELDKLADYVFVDCSNTAEFVKCRIQEEADLIVVNVSQEEEALDEYFSYPSSFRYKSIYCIGNYVGEEPCNLKNIQRLYRIDKKRISIIPYNVEFQAAVRRGKAVSFFQNYQLRLRNYKHKDFFYQIFKLVDMIKQWEEDSSWEKGLNR